MQTFVVKLASGIAALIASVCLSVFHISADETIKSAISGSSVVGLRMTMTVLPMLVLLVAFIVFKKHYILTDEKLESITKELKSRQKH